jgi:hypothetical protein
MLRNQRRPVIPSSPGNLCRPMTTYDSSRLALHIIRPVLHRNLLRSKMLIVSLGTAYCRIVYWGARSDSSNFGAGGNFFALRSFVARLMLIASASRCRRCR